MKGFDRMYQNSEKASYDAGRYTAAANSDGGGYASGFRSRSGRSGYS